MITDGQQKELKRIKLKKALSESFGAWKDKDHPELRKGTDAYVRSLRKSSRLSRTK